MKSGRFIFNLFIIFSLILTIFITSCSEDSNTTAPPAGTPNIPMARFSDIQEKVFNTTCATANCHASGSAQAGLVLSQGQSYSNLVEVQSVLYPNLKRVDTGNSGESLLIQILRGTRTPRMPFNGSPLSSAVIDSIAKWIDDGALNN